MDITVRIQTAVAQCFGVNIKLEQPVFMERDDLAALGALGLTDTQLYAFIYQRIEEEQIRNGLITIETENDKLSLRLQEHCGKDKGSLHLKLIKRKEMLDNQFARKIDSKKSTDIQVRATKGEKDLWKQAAKMNGYKSFSAWSREQLNAAANEIISKRESS